MREARRRGGEIARGDDMYAKDVYGHDDAYEAHHGHWGGSMGSGVHARVRAVHDSNNSTVPKPIHLLSRLKKPGLYPPL